jgi:hypothetical protein
VKKHVASLLQDFLLNDRRIADRPDVTIGLRWGDTLTAKQLWQGYGGMARSPLFPLQFSFSDGQRCGEIDIRIINGPSERDRHDLALLAFLIAYFATSLPLPRQLGRQLKGIRESLGLEPFTVADSIDVPGIKFSAWETGAKSPKGSEMYRWCQALGLLCPPKTALVRVVDFSPELVRFLQEDPGRLRSLTADQFERFVAERLDRMGYNVTLTGATNRNDGGIDLIAVPKLASVGSVVIAGQMKHHSGDQRTGRDAIDRLLAWKDSYFGVGLLVTNTSFTKDAVWTAQQERNARFLRLRDFTDLKRWLEDRFGEENDWREIPDRIELAPGVVIEIPRPRIITSFPGVERDAD